MRTRTESRRANSCRRIGHCAARVLAVALVFQLLVACGHQEAHKRLRLEASGKASQAAKMHDICASETVENLAQKCVWAMARVVLSSPSCDRIGQSESESGKENSLRESCRRFDKNMIHLAEGDASMLEAARNNFLEMQNKAKAAWTGAKLPKPIPDIGDDCATPEAWYGPFLTKRMSVNNFCALSARLPDPKASDTPIYLDFEIADRPAQMTPFASDMNGSSIEEAKKLARMNVLQSKCAAQKTMPATILLMESSKFDRPTDCFELTLMSPAQPAPRGSGPANHSVYTSAMVNNSCRDTNCDKPCDQKSRGYAQNSELLVANEKNADFVSALNWALGHVKVAGNRTPGLVIGNAHSLVNPPKAGLSRYDVLRDWATVNYPWPTIFTAAGMAGGPRRDVTNRGFNVLTVGNVRTKVDGTGALRMISSARSENGPACQNIDNCDRELPEIAAPGTQHILFGSDGFGGTSASTIVAASLGALVMEKNENLRIWPEAIRAIILATAVEQSPDRKLWQRVVQDSTDGEDGVGMIDGLLAQKTAVTRVVQGRVDQLCGDNCATGHDYGTLKDCSGLRSCFPQVWVIKLPKDLKNKKFRAAFTWNSNTESQDSVLDADLDLCLFHDGQKLECSNTRHNNYEMIEIFSSRLTPGKTYELRVFTQNYESSAGRFLELLRHRMES